MIEPFSSDSFFNIWYWVLTIAVWTQVSHRVLGVPYDMILRARRLPQVADRVDVLARLAAWRVASAHDRMGVPLAALAGFGLAVLGALGFLNGIEAAQAAFALLFPLALVSVATVRLALDIRRTGAQGEALRRLLARRRVWNQVIAVAAILSAAVLALAHPPHAFY